MNTSCLWHCSLQTLLSRCHTFPSYISVYFLISLSKSFDFLVFKFFNKQKNSGHSTELFTWYAYFCTFPFHMFLFLYHFKLDEDSNSAKYTNFITMITVDVLLCMWVHTHHRAHVFSPHEAYCKSQQSHYWSLHQEMMITSCSTHHQTIYVVSNTLPYCVHSVPITKNKYHTLSAFFSIINNGLK